MAPIPRAIGDFSILPISIPLLPSYPKSVIHHLYVRKNAPRDPTEDDSRSLFLTNVPVDSTEEHFRAIFVTLVGAGRFESITFESDRKNEDISQALEPAQAARLQAHSKKRKRAEVEAELAKEEEAARLPDLWTRQLKGSGSTAVALLAEDRAVDLVLKAISKVHKTKKYPVWGEGINSDRVPPLGSQWILAHNRLSYPDELAIQKNVDAFFHAFNRRETEAASLAKRLRSEPDEDGFVTVTRGGRKGPAGRNEAEEARKRMVEREETKKAELTNFYRFQARERRKADQEELIKKFEEDRRKVSAMKEKRGKFRPEV